MSVQQETLSLEQEIEATEVEYENVLIAIQEDVRIYNEPKPSQSSFTGTGATSTTSAGSATYTIG